MKASAIYLKAAKQCDSGTFPPHSCWSIQKAQRAAYYGPEQPGLKTPAVLNYETLFRPEQAHHHVWAEGWHEPGDVNALRHCRVLALLFMHHIAKDDERR